MPFVSCAACCRKVLSCWPSTHESTMMPAFCAEKIAFISGMYWWDESPLACITSTLGRTRVISLHTRLISDGKKRITTSAIRFFFFTETSYSRVKGRAQQKANCSRALSVCVARRWSEAVFQASREAPFGFRSGREKKKKKKKMKLAWPQWKLIQMMVVRSIEQHLKEAERLELEGK